MARVVSLNETQDSAAAEPVGGAWEPVVAAQPAYREILAKALPFLGTRKNELHTRISIRCAVALLAGEGGDVDVVIPGVLLHDVGWSAVPESLQSQAFGHQVSRPDLQRLHEEEGARLARDILQEVGYPADKILEIANIVSRHDTDPVAVSLNDSLVKDADKLWRFTREGVEVDVERFHREAVEYLDAIESKIDEWFFTGTAIRMARAEVEKRKTQAAAARSFGPTPP